MDQQEFGELVAKAVSHLYDSPYLQTHRLGQLLVGDLAHDGRGRELQRILLDAIQSLKPSAESAGNPHAWRTYRYLFLRDVQAFAPRDVAVELAISERQARRISREALDALASVLWDRYRERISQKTSQSSERHLVERSASAAGAPASARDAGLATARPHTEFRSDDSPGDSLMEEEVRHLTTAGRGSSTSIEEVLEGLRPILSLLARKHRCSWTTTVDPNLPGLRADRSVVRQILLNLSGIALEREDGGLSLSAGCDVDGVRMVLEFVPSAPRPPAGHIAGAGPDAARLALSRRLVETEEGTLDLRMGVGGALTIAVTLPPAWRPTVLVVDDNPDVATVLRRYLETAAFDVLVASNGADGLRLAQETHPSAITLDVMMASQDGWETLQLLKNDPTTRDIPVIICSVLREEELARILGASALLLKPVTRMELLSALARCDLPVPPRAHQRGP